MFGLPVIQPPIIQPPVGQSQLFGLPVIQSPVIQPPVIQPPVIQPPVIQPPVIQPPVIQPPVIQPPVIQPPVIQPPVIQPPVIQPPVIQPEGNITVQEPEKGSDEGYNRISISQGKKRKGDKPVAKPAKKTKDTENVNMAEDPTENIAGKEVEEGTPGSSEGKEWVGKLTLSGCVPLMPTHLAEAGYKAVKKGV